MTDVVELPVRIAVAAAAVPDTLTSYRRLAADLAATATGRDADLAAVDAAYANGVAAAEAVLAEAVAAARGAESRAAAAAAAVVHVDAEAGRLWEELRKSLGWRGVGLGAVPAPVAPPPQENAPALLARAAERIGALRRDAPRRPLPWLVLPLLPPLGAATATAVGLVAGGLAALGQGPGGGHLAVRLVAYAAFLLAPFAGVPVAAALADRRLGSRLDTGAIGLVVFGGLAAGCALSIALR